MFTNKISVPEIHFLTEEPIKHENKNLYHSQMQRFPVIQPTPQESDLVSWCNIGNGREGGREWGRGGGGEGESGEEKEGVKESKISRS